jgi:hypothetical protein
MYVGCISDQLATYSVSGTCPFDVTLKITAVFLLFLHFLNFAEDFIVAVLIHNPQIDCLPV